MNSSARLLLEISAYSLLHAINDPVIAIDSHGIVIYINSAATQIFGFTQDELHDQPVTLLMSEPYRSEHQSYIERYLSSDVDRTIASPREVLAQSKDGRNFPLAINVSEVCVDGNTWFYSVVQDLSENSALQRSLVAQRERFGQISRLSTLGEMSANIAHEINQPLAAIAMYAQTSHRLLGEDDVDTSKLRNALEKLTEQTIRAGEVIERIQNLVRLEAGTLQEVSINQLLIDFRPLILADVKASGLELEMNLLTPSPVILCDSIQIQHVLLNLVRNAVDAMLEIKCRYGRVISINCDDSSPGMVSVSVVDRGPGVAESLKAVIFDAFQTTKATGTGMGLAVSRSTIEQHNGTLSCSSTSDRGATFTFRLPSISNLNTI